MGFRGFTWSKSRLREPLILLGLLVQKSIPLKIAQLCCLWGEGGRAHCSVPLWIYCLGTIQAYLGDTAGLVSDHCSKVSITIKWVKANNLFGGGGSCFQFGGGEPTRSVKCSKARYASISIMHYFICEERGKICWSSTFRGRIPVKVLHLIAAQPFSKDN